jgi:hypothetical protein
MDKMNCNPGVTGMDTVRHTFTCIFEVGSRTLESDYAGQF